MTQAEFKAWFTGFTEALDGLPNKEQWECIKERVKEIDGKEVTERVFIDRYLPQYIYPPYYYNHPYYGGVFCNVQNQANITGAQQPNLSNWHSLNTAGALGDNYQSANAMYALGKADASLTDNP